eukprot:320043_1
MALLEIILILQWEIINAQEVVRSYGCIDFETYTEISPNELYACPKSTECSTGYHVCASSAEMESLGFTSELCMNIPQDDEFFAIQQINTNLPEPSDLNSIIPFIQYFNTRACADDDDDSSGLMYGCSNSNNVTKRECGTLSSIFSPISTANFGVFCCTDNAIPGIGCKQQREEIELIENKVYACNGVRYSGMAVYTENSGETLQQLTDNAVTKNMEIMLLDNMICGDGYHICYDDIELDYLGVNQQQCANNQFKDKFYATLAGTQSFDCGADGIYGCSSKANIINNPNNECNILNSMINSDSLLNTDGLLCCVDDDRSTGCNKYYSETEIIEDKVYACSGKYKDFEHADSMGCNAFYHVCNSAQELDALGLTQDKCFNL